MSDRGKTGSRQRPDLLTRRRIPTARERSLHCDPRHIWLYFRRISMKLLPFLAAITVALALAASPATAQEPPATPTPAPTPPPEVSPPPTATPEPSPAPPPPAPTPA